MCFSCIRLTFVLGTTPQAAPASLGDSVSTGSPHCMAKEY